MVVELLYEYRAFGYDFSKLTAEELQGLVDHLCLKPTSKKAAGVGKADNQYAVEHYYAHLQEASNVQLPDPRKNNVAPDQYTKSMCRQLLALHGHKYVPGSEVYISELRKGAMKKLMAKLIKNVGSSSASAIRAASKSPVVHAPEAGPAGVENEPITPKSFSSTALAAHQSSAEARESTNDAPVAIPNHVAAVASSHLRPSRIAKLIKRVDFAAAVATIHIEQSLVAEAVLALRTAADRLEKELVK